MSRYHSSTGRRTAFHRWFIAVAVLVAGVATSSAQTVQFSFEAEQLFQQAVQAFHRADYRQAEHTFGLVLDRYPGTQRSTAATLMRANALYRLNENYEASKAARGFISTYPSSLYIADTYLLLARIYAKIERYDEARDAVVHAMNLLSSRSPDRLVEAVETVGDSILLRHVPLASVQSALVSSNSTRVRAYLWKKVAERNLASGDFVAARAAIDTLNERYAGNVPLAEISSLRLGLGGASNIHIAALLPLMRSSPSSPLKDIANDVYDGILAAIDRFELVKRSPVRITLETRDTERDNQKATDMARELVKDSRVVGILGPIYSSTTIAAARIAGANGVPLLTPTANQNGIAALGSTVFQANPDYEQRGRAMARYAVQRLGARVVGVLAPSDTYAKFLADAFIKEANALGATVADVEWYTRGAADLRSQFMELRRAARRISSEPVLTFGGKMSRSDIMKLIRVGAPPDRIDSLLTKGARVRVSWLLGPRGLRLLDSIGVKSAFDETGLDSLAHPEAGITALYCPISGPEEISAISSQVAYHGLTTRILGSGEWNSPAELDANRRYTLGVQFESDSYADTSSTEYKDFTGVFRARFHRTPGKNVLYGYDAATMMLNLVDEGATSRDGLARAMAAVKSFRGVKGTINFSAGRVNQTIHVMQYTSDGILSMGEYGPTPQ